MMIHVPTYMPGTWSLAFCSKGGLHPRADMNNERVQAFVKDNSLEYYNSEMHSAAFALPNYVHKLRDEFDVRFSGSQFCQATPTIKTAPLILSQLPCRVVRERCPVLLPGRIVRLGA